MTRSRTTTIVGVTAALAAAVWLSWFGWTKLRRPAVDPDDPRVLRAVFWEAGYGDAAWVTTPAGAHLLIDAGPGTEGATSEHGHRIVFSTKNVLSTVGDRLAGRGVRRVYAAIVTHSHYDHWGGLERMIDNGSVTVDRVYEYAEPADDPAYGRFRRKLAAKGIPLLPLLAGGRVPLPDRAVRLDVIGPRHSYSETESDSANRSLVLRLAYGDFSILFAGDAHARAEMDAMEGAEELDSTVLKVANHGNRASSVSPFLDAVRPNLAVVSVEYPNPFGAPHDETLGKLIDRGIDYYRTDLDGDVIVLSDGETWTAWTER